MLTGGKWQPNEAIRATPGPYAVRGECIGDTLTLFESNHEIASVRDRTIRGPHVGVFLESFAEPNPVIKVTTLAVRALRQPRPRDRVGRGRVGRPDAHAAGLAQLRPARPEGRAHRQGRARTRAECGPVTFVAMRTPKQGAREFDAHPAGERRRAEDGRRPAELPEAHRRAGSAAVADGRNRHDRPAAPRDRRLPRARRRDRRGVDPHAAGVVGVRRGRDRDRAAWKGYGPDWPAFALRERPLGALGEEPPG